MSAFTYAQTMARSVVAPLGGGQLALQLNGPTASGVAGGSNLASLTTTVGDLLLASTGGGLRVQASTGNVGVNRLLPTVAMDVSGAVNASAFAGGCISNSLALSSTIVAASATACSNAYFVAAAAYPKSGGTLAGALTVTGLLTASALSILGGATLVYASNVTGSNLVVANLGTGSALAVSQATVSASQPMAAFSALTVCTTVGVGKSAPSTSVALDVSGSVAVSGPVTAAAFVGSGLGLTGLAWTVTSNVTLPSGSNVGLGSTAPACALDVSGSVRVSGQATLSSNVGVGKPPTSGNALDVSGNVAIVGASASASGAAQTGTQQVDVFASAQTLLPAGLGAVAGQWMGQSVATSSDGTVVAVGGPNTTGTGATWVYRWNATSSSWGQTVVVGDGSSYLFVALQGQGVSVALSSDGTTLAVGALYCGTIAGNGSNVGAVYVFKWDGTTWNQQAALQGPEFIAANQSQGTCCALSSDGLTLAFGGSGANGVIGATWVFRSDGTSWTEQANLVGTGGTGSQYQGGSCALSSDGRTLAIGGQNNNSNVGATWVFRSDGTTWTQQAMIVGTGATTIESQGYRCALSSNGNTLAVGGWPGVGGTWIHQWNGSSWTQQAFIVGTGAIGIQNQGTCTLSSDGLTLAIGGSGTNANIGATWVFRSDGTSWTQQTMLVGTGWTGYQIQGASCILSPDGTRLVVGAPGANGTVGAVWVFNLYLPGTSATLSLAAAASLSGTVTFAPAFAVPPRLSITAVNSAPTGGGAPVMLGSVTAAGFSYRATNVTGSALAYAHSSWSFAWSAAPNHVVVTGNVNVRGYLRSSASASVFYAIGSTPGVSSAASASAALQYKVAVVNTGGCYNASTCTFTAPVTGLYSLSATLPNNASWASFYRNGFPCNNLKHHCASDDPSYVNVIALLTALDAVQVVPGAATTVTGGHAFYAALIAPVATVYRDACAYAQTLLPAGIGAAAGQQMGASVAMSSDGTVVAVGGPGSAMIGGTWVYRWNGVSWTQTLVVGTGMYGTVKGQGRSCALSADGLTLAVGGPFSGLLSTTLNVGATWVFRWDGSTWAQKAVLQGTGGTGTQQWQGTSCSLSANGMTLAVGGMYTGTTDHIGATWVFSSSNGGTTWSQRAKLVGTGWTGSQLQGVSVALSADGRTLAVGGMSTNSNVGATWVFVSNGSTWTQQAMLVGTGMTGYQYQGYSVSFSSDGRTLAVGAQSDSVGATFIFRYIGTAWTQSAMIVGTGATGYQGQGGSCALSSDGRTLVVGGWATNSGVGATWVHRWNGSAWTQQAMIVGTGWTGDQGQGGSCVLSSDGLTLVTGGLHANAAVGAVWVFNLTFPS